MTRISSQAPTSTLPSSSSSLSSRNEQEKSPNTLAGPTAWSVVRAAGMGLLLFANPASAAATKPAATLDPSPTGLRPWNGDVPPLPAVSRARPRELLDVRAASAAPLPGVSRARPRKLLDVRAASAAPPAGVADFQGVHARGRAAIAQQIVHEGTRAALLPPEVGSADQSAAGAPSPAPPKIVRFSSFTSAQLEKFDKDTRAHVTKKVIRMHVKWHDLNGPGGTNGEGSGKTFLDFHAEMIAAGEAHFKEMGWGADFVFPDYAADTDIPKELRDPARRGEPKRQSSKPRVTMPPWLTVDGNGDAKTWGKRDALFQRSKLSEFASLDELGRAIGELYHAEGHVAIGGVMSTFESPRDPVFWGWHKHIDNIAKAYLSVKQTCC